MQRYITVNLTFAQNTCECVESTRCSSSVTLVTGSRNINILRARILLGMSITQFVNSDAINIPHNLRTEGGGGRGYTAAPENIFITCTLMRVSLHYVRDFAGAKRNGKILLTKNPEIPLFPFKFQKRILDVYIHTCPRTCGERDLITRNGPPPSPAHFSTNNN